MTTKNGQYQIPQSNTPSVLIEDTVVKSSIIDNRRIKELEQDIIAFRNNASEIHVPRSRRTKFREAVAVSARKSLYERLVEQESIMGGTLFGAQHPSISRRFWFHEGDWFFEHNDGIAPVVARYQITEAAAYKLVEGREHPFADGELSRLFEAITTYHATIRDTLYRQSDSAV